MLARRLLVIMLILMGMSVLAVSVEPPPQPVEPARPTAEPPAREGVADRPDAQSEVISADEQGQRVVVELGRQLHLEVTSSKPTSVQVGRDGPISSVQPELPARFDLLADKAGRREILLLDPPRPIGQLIVRR